MVFQPGSNKFAMMNLQIIQNQKYLLLRVTNQPLHKADQPLLVHSLLIDHKADLPLAADGGNHIDPLPLRLHGQYGGMALG